MRRRHRPRSSGVLGSTILAGVAGLLVLAPTGSGCGRVGFDSPAAGDAARPVLEASVERDGAPDAPEETPSDAPVDASVEADVSVDAGSMDAPADAMCALSVTVDYCTALPPLPAPPVIDGLLDCGPALIPMPPVDWIGPAPLPPFPDGNSAELAAAWRPDGLYIFMAVKTPAAFPADAADPVFYGAGAEVFVDSDAVYAGAPAYDNPGAIQLIAAAPIDAMTPSRRAEGFRNATDEGPWASTQFAVYPSATGFVFEGFVVAADLGLSSWALSAGAAIGFDVAVDVSYTTAAMTGAQGHRVGQYFFRVGTAAADAGDAAAFGLPYGDPRSFCSPTLAPM